MENSILKDAIQEIARLESSKSTVREIDGHTYLINSNDYADGGMWKFAARHSIKEYLTNELAELIKAGRVVVTM